MIRLVLLGVSAALAAGLLFVNLYTSIVDAPNWGASLPGSIEAARKYFSVANPGNFFRIFSPVNQVLALLAVIACWKVNRYLAIASMVVAISIDIFTFAYFYPRNEIMFVATLNTESLRAAWEQWSAMNWLRSILCFVNTALAFILLISTVKRS